jgi:DNA-binding transcriptional ArsR family regulator
MSTDHLSSTFAALADPTRRAILASLAKGETTVQKLASPFDMSLPAVSKHLKVLEKAGLIERGRDAQYRPCRLQPAPLKDVAHWLDRYRQMWEERFDRLESFLQELQAEQKTGKQQMDKSMRTRRARTKGAKHGSRKSRSDEIV